MYSKTKMESEETKWLKKRYRPAPTEEVQNIKKIKFEHIRKDMTAQFPSKNLSNYQVSKALPQHFRIHSVARVHTVEQNTYLG